MQFILLTSTDCDLEREPADPQDRDSRVFGPAASCIVDAEELQADRTRENSSAEGLAFPIRGVKPKFIAALNQAKTCKSVRLLQHSAAMEEDSLKSKNLDRSIIQSDNPESNYLHLIGDFYSTYTEEEEESLLPPVPEEISSPAHILEGAIRRRLSSPVYTHQPLQSDQHLALQQPNASKQFASAQMIRIKPKIKD